MNKLASIHACLLDMDGTIYNGNTLFPETNPFMEFLEKHGIRRLFLSNNSSYSTSDYVAKLSKMGVRCSEEDFYTSTDYTIDYLHAAHPAYKRIYFLGMKSVFPMFEKAGFVFDDTSPDAVVIAFDRELTYEKLCRAAWHISRGVPAFATHPDNFCPTDEPVFLVDCGALTACLERAASKKIKVLGKPDPGMIRYAAKRIGLTASQCLMTGDRLATDIACGVNAHALTCHLSPSAPNPATGDVKADFTCRGLGELMAIWEKSL